MIWLCINCGIELAEHSEERQICEPCTWAEKMDKHRGLIERRWQMLLYERDRNL